MSEVLDKIAELKIVPVVVLEDEKDAVETAEALLNGGLGVAEITFRTAAAEQSIINITKAFPDMLVGAGTVVNVEQAERALKAGAKFIVTPGFSSKVTEFCLEHNIPVVPGILTPTEIMMAMEYGLDLVKFFPAGQNGGVKTIKALSGPFPNMHFMPTGGVSSENIMEYLNNPKVVACGGSWMVTSALIKNGNWDEITRLTKEAVELVKGE